MGEPGKDTLEQSGFSTDDLQRKAGDVIKSQDWNVLVNEIGKLGRSKVDLDGERRMSGPLALAGSLIVQDGETGDPLPKPECGLVVQKDMYGELGAELALVNKGNGPDTSVAINFGVDDSTYAKGEGNAQIKVTNLGTANASKMAFSTWDGTGFGERLTIMPDGAIGIGTAKPECKLVIQKDTAGALGAELALVNKSNDTDTSVAINFGVDDTTYAQGEGNAQIKVTNLGSANASKMAFSTWDGTGFGERMTIMPDGRIGLDTPDPQSRLHVNGDITCNGRIADEKVRKFDYHNYSGQTKKALKVNPPYPLEELINLEFESRDAVLRFDFTAANIYMEGIEGEGGLARFELLVDGESVDICDESFGPPAPAREIRRVFLTRMLQLKAGKHSVRVDWGLGRPENVKIEGSHVLCVGGGVQLSAIEL